MPVFRCVWRGLKFHHGRRLSNCPRT
jgi:hypothetical protein